MRTTTDVSLRAAALAAKKHDEQRQREWEHDRQRALMRETNDRAATVRALVARLVGRSEPVGELTRGKLANDFMVEYSGARFWLSTDGADLTIKELLCDRCGRWFACARVLPRDPEQQLVRIGHEYELHLQLGHARLGFAEAR